MTQESYQIYIDGHQYQKDFLKIILLAQKSITLHTYIFHIDSFGQKVQSALVKKAKSGVKVSLLVDYIGSFSLSQNSLNLFEETENLNFRFFNPFKFPKLFFIGRRLHHKILVADGQAAMVGGINVIDGIESEFPKHPRLDFALYLEGPMALEIDKYCSFIFDRARGELGHCKDFFKGLKFDGQHIFLKTNDWFYDRKQITDSYRGLIAKAQKSIILIHGYFFPSFKILGLLKKKAREGVSITIVLPRYSDWKSWVWATEHLYQNLIKNEVKIMEWALSNLHGKMAIVDEQIITLGSHNLNYTSSYGNLEMNVEIHDSALSQKIAHGLARRIIKESIEITERQQRGFKLTRKIRNRFFFLILVSVSTLTINFIKFGQQLARMRPLQITSMMALLLLGAIGLVIPLIPGLPFLLAAMILFMGNRPPRVR